MVQVGLGDSDCDSTWTPYARRTIQHVAEHELGHALGLNHSLDSADVMYAIYSQGYSSPCQVVSSSQDIPPSTWFHAPFSQEKALEFSYWFRLQDGAYLDVYLVSANEQAALESGSPVTMYGQHERVQEDEGKVQLPAGDFVLDFFCRRTVHTCSLEFVLWQWDPAWS